MKLILTVLFGLCTSLSAQQQNFDLKWSKVPSSYIEGAFLGNGEQGTNIWARPEESLHFDIGDTRIYDGTNRAPIGKFVLKTKSVRKSFEMGLSLEDAEAKGEIKTESGAVAFKAISVSGRNLSLVEFSVKGGEQIDIESFALPGLDTSSLRNGIGKILKKQTWTISDYSHPDYREAIVQIAKEKKLKPEALLKEGGVTSRVVPLKSGQVYVLTWSFSKSKTGKYLLAWRTDYTREKLNAAALDSFVKKGRDLFKKDLSHTYDQHFNNHKSWWNNYFEKSFISLPDKRIEAYYKWQFYKVASATRKGKLPIDLMGPWFRATNWPKIWANLNVQLTYLPMAVANQAEIGDTLFDFIDENNQFFIDAVKGPYKKDSATSARAFSPYASQGFSWEYGNFLWILHNYWHQLKVNPDASRTRDKFYPILKRGINYVLHNCELDDQGILHTPKDISPEYEVKKVFPKVRDTSYNIGFLRWGLECAIHLNEKYNLEDEDAKRYKKALAQLAPLHIDPYSGIMIGEGVKLEKAHRHYSHLVGLYPIRQIDLDDPKEFALAKKTTDFWVNQKIVNDWSYKGYSRTGAVAMYSMLNEPEEALRQMNLYLDQYGSPNTLYIESGPVIETPISAAASVHEMLLQSWSPDFKTDLIRLFPGVPKTWKNLSFDNLRAEGGYTVSARREAGKLIALRIEAIADGKLDLRVKTSQRINLVNSGASDVVGLSKGGWQTYKLAIRKGDVLTFGDQTKFRDAVLGTKGEDAYHFGKD
jgi:alpha-L-fucosidase 2